MARLLGPLRRLLAHMKATWQPGPEHRLEEHRVDELEARAESKGAQRRAALDLRLEVIQRGREAAKKGH